jgi:hypothetical protein
MNARRRIRAKRTEEGIALLISIFVLLLISVVAIALIVSSSTESALAGNYRLSTGAYYAAIAGLEEARSRLQPKNPSYFGNTSPGFLPSPGTPLAVGFPVYVINPLGSETVAPWDPSSAYYDKQYNQEFASSSLTLPPSPHSTYSVWYTSPLNTLSFPGPLYKWVRINAVSEQSLNLLVAPTYSAPYDSTTPMFYDGTQLNISNSGAQVLELTALAVLPNGSQKLVQYLVAPILSPLVGPNPLSFPAALTLDGNGVIFNTNTSPNFWVRGNDQYNALNCSSNPPSAVPAIGFTNSSDLTNITSKIPSGPPPAGNPDLRGNYTNLIAPTPNVTQVPLPASLSTVAGLNALVQAIKQNPDVAVITPSGQLTDANNFMPAAMSATNPMTIVINGDLTINGWHHHGYGLLLVTGKLTYDPDAFWHGIILVIGKGWFYSYQGSSTGGHIEGAVFIAQTIDPTTGNPLSSLGASRFDFTSSSLTPSGGNVPGIYYSNCWARSAMPSYKVLSFHEVSQ